MAFREAKATKIGGKFLAYGETGSGKSWFQLTFPNVACIDSEAGIGFYENKSITLNNGKTYNNLKLVDNTSDLDTLEEDLDAFLDGEYEGEINTLSIDSETKFYSTMQVSALEVEERRARRKGGDIDDAGISVKQWGRIKLINMKFQQAKIDLSSRGMHIVSIAQQTEVKDDKSEKIIGYKPDMHKSVGFDYDVVLRFFKKKNKDNDDCIYYAEVIKDRTGVTKVGSIIENPCYDIWKDFFDGISNLDTLKTSYRNDLDKSTDDMIDKDDKAEDIVSEWKPLMKELTASGNTSAVKQINAFIKDKGLNIKNMTAESPDILAELLDLTKSLS